MSQAKAEIVDIEKKRADVDFENVWHELANKQWHELKEACRFAYDSGRGAGKAEGKRILSDEIRQLLS